MKRNIYLFSISILCIFTLLLSVNASDVNITSDNATLNVSSDFSQSVDNAKVENKPAMIIFDQSNCVYCEMLKQQTLNNTTVINELNEKFIVVMLDINKNSRVASNYKVYGTPTAIFVDGDAKELHRIEGFVEADELLNEIKEI